MKAELKEELIATVRNVVDQDMLTDEDALMILEVCKVAAERKIADVSEQIMMGRVEGTIQ